MEMDCFVIDTVNSSDDDEIVENRIISKIVIVNSDEENAAEKQLINDAVEIFIRLKALDFDIMIQKKVNEIVDLNDVYLQIRKKNILSLSKAILGTTLASHGLADHFVKTLQLQPPAKYFEPPYYENIKSYKRLMWNLSDSSVDLCKDIGHSNVFKILITELSSPTFHHSNFKDEQGDQNLSLMSAVKSDLGIILNSLRLAPLNKYKLRMVDGIHTILELTKTTFLMIKTKALFILAFAAEPDDKSVLATTKANIDFIIDKVLIPALSQSSHIGKRYSFSVEELLLYLSMMAINDENSLAMVNSNILPIILKVLENPISKQELSEALHLLWRLSFPPENKEVFASSEKLYSLMKDLSAQNDLSRESSKSLDGAWLELEKHFQDRLPGVVNASTVKLATESNIGDVHCMISYCWHTQDLAFRVRNALEANDVPIWIDVEQMEGCVLTQMAEAVEKSFAVILCLSESYQNSTACRSEAMYAYRCKKLIIPIMMEDNFQPSSWLGILVGTSLYYNVFLESEFDASITKIVTYITKETPAVPKISKATNSSLFAQNSQQTCQWSAEEVSSWIKKAVKSNAISNVAQNLDGDNLKELQILLRTAPDFTLKLIQNELDFKDPIRLLRFCAALRNL